MLCALFWIVLVQTSAGLEVWGDTWNVMTMISGAVAIVAMGYWSGLSSVAVDRTHGRRMDGTTQSGPSGNGTGGETSNSGETQTPQLQQLTWAIDRFDEWLEANRNESDPWSRFDELVRSVLYHCCRATHVRPYRLRAEGQELIPLREPDPLVETEHLSARGGIVGHVVTTGRSYISGDHVQGELVEQLAANSGRQEGPGNPPIVWCFAVRRGTRRLGAVTAAQLDIPPECNRALMRAVERLISQFWCALSEAVRSRSAISRMIRCRDYARVRRSCPPRNGRCGNRTAVVNRSPWR